MKACKNCGNLISENNYGLRRFCSRECKIAYRKEYLKQKKQQERQRKNVNNTDGYVNTYCTMSTIPDGLTLVKRIVSVHKIFSRKFASIHIKQI